MSAGALFFISFLDDASELRFKQWVLKGNESSKNKLIGSFGLTAKVLLIRDKEYLFLWEHSAVIGLSWLLRLMFFILARKMRKGYVLRNANRFELADLILAKGL